MQTLFPLTIRSLWRHGRAPAAKACPRERRELAPRETFKQTVRGATKISCTTGSLWVTSDLGREDFILRHGESISPPKGAVVVVEALERSCVEWSVR